MVLLVEDNEDARHLCGAMLLNAGYDVRPVTESVTAVETARELCPDMIVLDLGLPVVGGAEIAAALREDGRPAGIPIIVWSAHALDGDVEEMRAIGVEGFVAKPCHLPDLVAEVDRWLRPERERRSKDSISRVFRFRDPPALPTASEGHA